MLDELLEARKRLLDIEYRLSGHVAARCGDFQRPQAGALFATRESFRGERMQAIAADALGTAQRPTIVHLVPGGSFARAGLQAGDILLALDDVPIATTTEFSQFMLAAQRATVRVTYQRGEATPTVAEVALDPACPIQVGFSAGALIVPWQAERLVVVVPLGLLRTHEDDDLVAVVIAHQYAHSLYDQRGDDALTAERRADRMGLQIAHATGYDVTRAVAYWEDVAMEYPLAIRGTPRSWRTFIWESQHRLTTTLHPEIAKRLPAIRETVRKIGQTTP